MTRAMTAAALAFCASGAWGFTDGPKVDPIAQAGHEFHKIPGTDFRGCGKAQFAAAMAKAGLGPGGESSYPLALRAQSSLTDTNLTHVDLDIEVFFLANELGGTSAMQLVSEVDGLTTFTFQLAANMNISDVSVDGVTSPFTTAPNGERVVTLPATKNTGDAFSVVVTYLGATVPGFFGSIDWVNVEDRVFPTDQAAVPMVFTLSQPYYSYTWWPCKDTALGGAGDYSDKFTLDFSIIGPAAFSSTANGMLQSVENLSGDRRKFSYTHSYEIPTYLVAFASSNYNTYQQTWNYGEISMPLDVWLTTANDQNDPANTVPQDEWFKMGDMLTVFSDLWGVYPFHEERYGMYEFDFSGGMEHQTNTGQLGWFFADWLTAHEAAHQWWGDWVTCKTWHDIWFQEGMASYAEVLYEEFQTGEAEPDLRRTDLMSGDYLPRNFDSSAYVYDASDPERMFEYDFTYLRGGWAWHMMRGMAGDDAFFQGLEDFSTWYGQSGADTAEILAAMNSSTELDFTELFDDYIYGSGAPAYEFAWETATVNGQDYLRLRLAQTQDPAQGSGGVFSVPVPLRLNSVDTVKAKPTLREQYFTIPTDSPTFSLEVDPENWVLKRFAAEGIMDGAPPVVVNASADEFSASFSFIEPVNTTGTEFMVLTDDDLELPQAFTYSYDGATNTAMLDFGAGLAGGDYVVTLSDAIVSTDELIPLDGESVDGAVPSGDGASGGDYVLRFSVLVPCLADTNGDGILDLGDINTFVALFLASDISADMNGDGILDLGDINTFVSLFLAGC